MVKSAGTKPVQYGRIYDGTFERSGKHGGSGKIVASEHNTSTFRIADPGQVKSLRG